MSIEEERQFKNVSRVVCYNVDIDKYKKLDIERLNCIISTKHEDIEDELFVLI